MPEGPELRLMADFLNQYKNEKILRTEKSSVTKIKIDDISNGVFMRAESRGKELMLVFGVEADTPSGFYPIKYFFSMGMSGNWLVSESEIPKHSHFQIFFDDKVVCMVDPRRFAKWRIDNNWKQDRSPDIMYERNEWVLNYNKRIKTLGHVSIYELLMNQKLFNGVGNYIRAEVLYKMDIHPNTTSRDVDWRDLLECITTVMQEAYAVGGLEMSAFKNPNDSDTTKNKGDWQQCYNKPNMSSIIDSNGRKFWYNPKWKWNL